MLKKNTRLPKTVPVAAFVLLLACGVQAQAQNAGSDAGNRPPETGATPPVANSPQPPPTNAGSGAAPPQAGAGGFTVGRVPGHTGQISTVQEKPDRVVEESEKQVSRRIKSICRGC